MTEERKQLIERFQKWLDTDPAPSLIASQCANIAEEYAKDKYKEGFALGTNKYNATTRWNNATKLNSVQETNGYWKALKDLAELGVIELDKIED